MKTLAPCGCKLIYRDESKRIELEFCPLHEAAEDLLRALKIIARTKGPFTGADASCFVKVAERALAKAKKETT